MMDPLADSGAIFLYHRYMIASYGTKSSLALGWLTPDDQLIRFEALAGIADLNNKTVLDAGCGFGDFFVFLSNIYQLDHYYGVEQIPEMLDEANKRHWPLEKATFISRNFLSPDLPTADYVFASGSLNYSSSDPGFIFKAIDSLFEHCRLGMAFNFLRSIKGSGLLAAYDPEIILDHCRSLSRRVMVKDDYSAEDVTIWMYR